MTAELPTTLLAFRKHKDNFTAWLIANGSEVMPPTNPYEIARFTTPCGVGLVHRNDGGRITSWQHGADRAFIAFRTATSWHAAREKPKRASKSDRIVLALIKRDGSTCMYCAREVRRSEMTLEHVVSVTHGGPNHMANYALACWPCNQTMGHLPARVKMERAIKLRAELATVRTALAANQ